MPVTETSLALTIILSVIILEEIYPGLIGRELAIFIGVTAGSIALNFLLPFYLSLPELSLCSGFGTFRTLTSHLRKFLQGLVRVLLMLIGGPSIDNSSI